MAATDDAARILAVRSTVALALGVVGLAVAGSLLWIPLTGGTLEGGTATAAVVATTIAVIAVIFGFGLAWKYARIGRIVTGSAWRRRTATAQAQRVGRRHFMTLRVEGRILTPANAASELSLPAGEHEVEVCGPLPQARHVVVRRVGGRRFGLYT